MPAVGTIGVPTESAYEPGMKEYRMLLTTDGSGGAVSGIPLTFRSGMLLAVEVIPALVTTQPTNLFDFTLLDSDGLDVLNARGVDLLNTGPTRLSFLPPATYNGTPLSPTIANGGNGKTAELVVTIGYRSNW
jgi:hypothetical protein